MYSHPVSIADWAIRREKRFCCWHGWTEPREQRDVDLLQEEFDFLEEDCALNKNINEKKEKFTMQSTFGSVNKNRLNFYSLCHVESQRRWSSGPFGFRKLMNCFGPDFFLVCRALSCFPNEVTSHGALVASLFRCLGQNMQVWSQLDLVRKPSIKNNNEPKKPPNKPTKLEKILNKVIPEHFYVCDVKKWIITGGWKNSDENSGFILFFLKSAPMLRQLIK